MKVLMRLLAGAAALVVLQPGAALAANYWMLGIDRTSLSVTDLRSPRNMGGVGTAFEIVINRQSVKIAKGQDDYTINRFDFNCAKGLVSRIYTAQYNMGGVFQASNIKPTLWTAIKPGAKAETLRYLSCAGAAPKTGAPLGDLVVHEMMNRYRAGAYDHFIH